MVLHLVRAAFLVVVLAVTISFAVQGENVARGSEYVTLYILIPAVVGIAAIFVDMFWRRKRLQVLSGLFFGLLAGLAIAYIFTLVIDLVVMLFVPMMKVDHPGPVPMAPETQIVGASMDDQQDMEALAASKRSYALAKADWESRLKNYNQYMSEYKTVQLIKLLVGSAVVFMCVSFVLQTKDDFRFVIPYVEFSKETKGARALLLDTSVIIDGRIGDIAETRILESEVLIPRFVLAELQAIADSDDKLKRNRGRRGLDVLNRLQSCDKIDIRIIDPHVSTVEEAPDVDAKLVALAQHLDCRIVTNDYNLNKVAQLRAVDVVNINDLSNALKPIVLPGEKLSVKVIKPGEEAGQGVGYLEDGTMIVAEQGRDYVGKEVWITVTSVLQTSAGRMIFGKLDPDRTFGPRRT